MMRRQEILPATPTDFSAHARQVLLHTKSTIHDSAKGNENLDLFLGELLLVCHLSGFNSYRVTCFEGPCCCLPR